MTQTQTVNEISAFNLAALASNANITDVGIEDFAAFAGAFRAALVARGYGETTTDEIPEGDWLAAINDALLDDALPTAWTAEGYWNAVLGTTSADRVVHEYDLTPDAVDQLRRDPDGTLDAWLCRSEAEAWEQGGEGGDQPAEWATFHADALARLTEAAARRAAEVA